jgi:hypothetical protein
MTLFNTDVVHSATWIISFSSRKIQYICVRELGKQMA